jgi:hypothetical protein
MENPFTHNRATNVIGKVLDAAAAEAALTDGEISFASLEYRIMMKLWEADCLTDHALETVGLDGRFNIHNCHDEHCPHKNDHACHDEHCHHHHGGSV